MALKTILGAICQVFKMENNTQCLFFKSVSNIV
ncbi:hypothetical protein CZ814_03966 [Photobacterium toruni]|uniref:Uncharacterized protein n=1 Tax=Photobacterium toruni TaxID=1935446 RepID=A0A1T4V0L1_9GAMM|nr:hypothetical protein CZ814_03966 [Photobacterium toruni]